MAPVWWSFDPVDEIRNRTGRSSSSHASQSTSPASVSSAAKLRASKWAMRTTMRVAVRSHRLAA